jgi:hypothetical protein
LVFAERPVDLLLTSQPDHQAKRLFYRLLLASVSSSFLRLRHQRVIDLDICTHGLHSVSTAATGGYLGPARRIALTLI